MIVTIKRIKEIIQEELQKIVQEGWKKKKYKKNDYKKYNKLVKRGKSVMVQTAYGDEFAWEDGSSYGVFASEEDGREIELDHDDIVDVMHEGNLTEMDNPWFEITYKDSRGRTKTDSMRANNPKEAKKDFVNLMKGRGFKVLKVVKEGKLSEKKFIPTVTIEKYGKEISVEKFKTTNDAKKYTKQMIKKYKLKWVKGFWGNPKTGIELTQNFS